VQALAKMTRHSRAPQWLSAAGRGVREGRGNAELSLSESSLEKSFNAIFAKLDLAAEQPVHRRLAAVLTFLRDASLRAPG
jgi:hypothetical protein